MGTGQGKLYIPKVGYTALRRRGGNPYPDGIPVKATVKKNTGKWYAVICYKMEAPVIEDTGGAVGIDRNCRQGSYGLHRGRYKHYQTTGYQAS